MVLPASSVLSLSSKNNRGSPIFPHSSPWLPEQLPSCSWRVKNPSTKYVHCKFPNSCIYHWGLGLICYFPSGWNAGLHVQHSPAAAYFLFHLISVQSVNHRGSAFVVIRGNVRASFPKLHAPHPAISFLSLFTPSKMPKDVCETQHTATTTSIFCSPAFPWWVTWECILQSMPPPFLGLLLCSQYMYQNKICLRKPLNFNNCLYLRISSIFLQNGALFHSILNPGAFSNHTRETPLLNSILLIELK